MLVGVIEDGGPVLGADIIALAVEGGRVVEVPEPIENFLVGDFLWVENDLDDFGMAGGAEANFVIGWVFDGSAHEPGGDGDDAIELPVDCLDAPVTTGCESGGFGAGGDFWNGSWGVVRHGGFLSVAGCQHGEDGEQAEGDALENGTCGHKRSASGKGMDDTGTDTC